MGDGSVVTMSIVVSAGILHAIEAITFGTLVEFTGTKFTITCVSLAALAFIASVIVYGIGNAKKGEGLVFESLNQELGEIVKQGASISQTISIFFGVAWILQFPLGVDFGAKEFAYITTALSMMWWLILSKISSFGWRDIAVLSVLALLSFAFSLGVLASYVLE